MTQGHYQPRSMHVNAMDKSACRRRRDPTHASIASRGHLVPGSLILFQGPYAWDICQACDHTRHGPSRTRPGLLRTAKARARTVLATSEAAEHLTLAASAAFKAIRANSTPCVADSEALSVAVATVLDSM